MGEIKWKKKQKVKDMYCENYFCMSVSQHIYFRRRLCNCYFAERKFVDHYHWIEEDEMLDLVAIAQSSPGAIAVNGAIIVGYKLAGIPGMLVSVIGAIIPPMVILSVISVFYDAFCSNYYIAALLKGMTAGVGAVIMSVVYDMGKNVVKSKDWVNVVIMIISFCLSYFLNVNIIYIILLVAVFGMVRTIVKGGREK